MFEFTPLLNSETPLYIQLYHYIKTEVTSKRLEPGTKLPSKRKLADHLALSLTTIEGAYQQLLAEGYVESKPRKGLFVVELVDFSKEVDNKRSETVIENRSSYQYDFSQGNVDLENFPFQIWKKLSNQCFDPIYFKTLQNLEPQGEVGLRREIATYLYQSRGVNCTPDQIIIGAGTQYLIFFLAQIIGLEKTYGLEEPGFHRVRMVLKNLGIKTIPLPLEDDGINIESVENSSANIVYVTPSHQFPTGSIMPITKRTQLLKWAQMNKGFIIEDDYDGEYRYEGKPIPSLQGLDHYQSVVYLGTFSKSLLPTLRLSFLVLPQPLLAKYRAAYSGYKQTVSGIHQKTLELFMKEGHWERHLNKMRTIYRKKQKIVLDTVQRYMGDRVEIMGEKSGLHILLRVKSKDNESELIEKAKTVGVKVYPTSVYYESNKIKEGVYPQILVGFGGHTEVEIKAGIKVLAEGWFTDGK